MPLFSLASTQSWGIGEFADLPMFARWAAEAGQSFVQILPINEMPPGETSPYSALTAMALDPIYISLPSVAGLRGARRRAGARRRRRRRRSTRRSRSRRGCDMTQVRQLKERWLRRALRALPAARGGARHAARAALRRLRRGAKRGGSTTTRSSGRCTRCTTSVPWWEWPEPLARAGRRPSSAGARRRCTPRSRYRNVSAVDRRRAVGRGEAAGVAGAGLRRPAVHDLRRQPRRVGAAARVPLRRDHRRAAGRVQRDRPGLGTAAVALGRDGGERLRLDARARPPLRRDLYDGFRIDHLVGLYRTYIRPIDKAVPAFFEPADEPAQIALGETLVGILGSGHRGADVDRRRSRLDPAVRARVDGAAGSARPQGAALGAALGSPGQPLDRSARVSRSARSPRPARTTSSRWRRRRKARPKSSGPRSCSRCCPSGSCLTLIPLQDVFGWTDRINTPAVVDEINWTWRVPWPVDTWLDREDTVERADQLKAWTRTRPVSDERTTAH